jgi:hypothetical protein
VLTMAIALDNGAVSPDGTYEDRGVLEVGGIEIVTGITARMASPP